METRGNTWKHVETPAKHVETPAKHRRNTPGTTGEPQDEMIHEWKLLHRGWINIDAIPGLAALAWVEARLPEREVGVSSAFLDVSLR